jgi:protein-tyrosine phosphatase
VHLDVLPPGSSGLTAPIVLLSAPGRFNPIDDDLRALVDRHSVVLLVSLVNDFELDALGAMDIADRARTHGITLRRFGFGDHSTPDSMDALSALVGEILAASRAGSTVGVHCWAGLGRTGLVVACCLVATGFTAERAMETVRRHRPWAIENTDQEEFVADFAVYCESERAREPRLP